MKVYSVYFGNFKVVMIKCNLNVKGFLDMLVNNNAIQGLGGTVYNLSKYESFYEVTNPDASTIRNAVTLDRLM